MSIRLSRLPIKNRTQRQSRTVRTAMNVVLASALILGLASVISESTSYISIVTTPQTVENGKQFYIDISATAHTPVNAVDIVLTYSDDQIEIDAIDTGTSVITLWTEEPYARDGYIHLRGGTFKKGFLGKHLIARVRGTARASGLAHVKTDSVQFIAGDGKGTEVSVNDSEEGETRIYITSKDGTLSGTAEMAIITDIDGNGKVDLSDISAFMSAWFTKRHTFDFNGDGRMTLRDFSILLSDSFFK